MGLKNINRYRAQATIIPEIFNLKTESKIDTTSSSKEKNGKKKELSVRKKLLNNKFIYRGKQKLRDLTII